jgi:hypothetical protein
VKLGLAAVLAPVAFAGTGCHETYCAFLGSLSRWNSRVTTDCEDFFGSDRQSTGPALGFENAAITWQGPVVAGQPKEFTATSTFEDKDRPLAYYWEIDGDDDYDDVVVTGEAGHKLTLALPEGDQKVKVKVTTSIYGSAGIPNRVAYGYAQFDVEPAPPGSSPPPTTPQPQNPPPANPTPQTSPLAVALELSPAPPDSVDVISTVTKGGARVSGARVEYDFRSDGSVDDERTTAGEGRVSARNEYPNGRHTVTVTAHKDGESATASRTFTYDNGTIAPKLVSAERPRSRAFSARLGLATLREGKTRRGRTTVTTAGELGMARVRGHVKGGTPAAAKALLDSTWLTRLSFSWNRRTDRITLRGVAVATLADQPGQACVHYSLRSGRGGRRFGTGRLTVVGGTGAAATTRAVASVKVTVPRPGQFRLTGKLTTGTRAARGLSPACQAILAEAARLPG